MTPQEICERIRQSVPMKTALEYYGFPVNRAGFMSCPFHSEKTGSFKVYDDNFYCYGCGESGDLVDFVQNYFKIGFNAAVVRINCDFGLNLPLDKKPSRDDEERIRRANEERKRRKAEEEKINKIRRRYLDMRCELWIKQKTQPLTRNEEIKLSVLDDWLDKHP